MTRDIRTNHVGMDTSILGGLMTTDWFLAIDTEGRGGTLQRDNQDESPYCLI